MLETAPARRDTGSFRDPSGGVVEVDGSIFREFIGEHGAQFERFLASPLNAGLTSSGLLIESFPVRREENPSLYAAENITLVVQHPRLPFVSYPYEWPFEMLKAAAELQLDVSRKALAQGYLVKDATPYNIQFDGPTPIFIDVASFETYEPGASWRPYAQFCRNFLNPLLLQAKTGVPYQPWLRSLLDGIDVDQVRSVLPLRAKFNLGVFIDVVLQSWLGHRFANDQGTITKAAARPVAKGTIDGLMARMAGQVRGLKRRQSKSTWGDYEATKTHYSPEAERFKEAFVRAKLDAARPATVWDLGCNAGQYSLIASEYAGYVVAMDSDELSVGSLYQRIVAKHHNILPLVVDLMNPSPDQGWAGAERKALSSRGRADWTLCLALIHHLAISGNVPFAHIVRWLASMTDYAIIEFVPKSDPMVHRLLATRQDVYPGYTEESFRVTLEQHFSIQERVQLPESERSLYVVGPR